MRRTEAPSRYVHSVLWKVRLEVPFNALICSEVFRRSQLSLVCSGEDGKVRLYHLESLEAAVRLQRATLAVPATAAALVDVKPDLVLETKGGPVHALVAHNVTRFYVKDLVCASSRGVMTVFCNEQIICRQRLSDRCLECATVHEDSLGNVAIILSDTDGSVFASTPYNLLWRVSLNEANVPSVPMLGAAGVPGLGTGPLPAMSPSALGLRVLCLAVAELAVCPGGEVCCYVLASDDCSRLFVISDGSVVTVLATPGNVTAMCSGHFVTEDKPQQSAAHGIIISGNSSTSAKQLAIATDLGGIHIIENFEISSKEYAHVGHSITHIMPLRATQRFPPGTSSALRLDAIVCAGQFAGAHVIHCGKLVDYLETSDWCVGLQLVKSDSSSAANETSQPPQPQDQQHHLHGDAGDGYLAIVACLDGTVHAFSCYSAVRAGVSTYVDDPAACNDVR